MPWSSYSADQSPFVTVLSHIGVPGAGSVMNLVVLTAAMSSLNSGMYSTGRILRTLAIAGSGPRIASRMNRNQVPYVGILITASVCVIGVLLNYVVPAQAFEIVLNFASIGIETSDEWIMERTGIHERRIASDTETTCWMAATASRQAMARAGVTAGEIDAIILSTATPDRLLPATAVDLQAELGATRAAAFDISAACSGWRCATCNAS